VVAKEYEVGARFAFTQRLNLSIAGFDVTKLTNGLRPDGIFAIVGEANHRGLEVSLSGEVIPGTTVVIGAMAMKPRLSGQLVDSGIVARKPAAVSSTVGLASIDHRLSWAPGWSVDSRVTWQGPRPANVTNTFSTKGYALLSAGGRFAFDWDGRQMLLRFAVSNLFTNRPFLVQPGGLFGQSAGTTGRISLRIGLVGD
jgi:iron complex outermembrane recepter protein